MTLCLAITIYVLNIYYTVYSYYLSLDTMLPLSEPYTVWEDTFENRFHKVNDYIVYKVIDYSNGMCLLYLFYSITKNSVLLNHKGVKKIPRTAIGDKKQEE